MSEPRVIADQHERELAATDLSTTYVVEAAAGTGKTTLLVERVLTIIREKQLPLSQIVAITFTEKAAGELKIKLRKMLEKAAGEEPRFTHLYRKALFELDTMPVSTIHSLCRELIQERPVEAGVEPNFSVASQATAELLRGEVWEEWIANEFSADCPAARPFLERGVIAGDTRGFSLRDIYEAMLDHREDLDELHVEHPDDDVLKHRIQNFREELQRDLGVLDQCRNSADGLVTELRKAADWLKQNDITDLQWMESAPSMSGRSRGQQANWNSKEALAAAQILRRGFEDRVQRIYSSVVSRWANDLDLWLKGGAAAYAQAKAQRGLLDFHDLLLIARNMLRDSKAAREFFKQRFAYILVDEFQDTDPLQAEIVFYLAERRETFSDDWEDVALVPGKLFIVGDPKQSIYRFRRADLDLYGKVRAKIEGLGKCLHIRTNFRSLPDILCEVNDVFSDHMTGARNGRYEPEYVTLKSYRDDAAHLPQTIFLSPPAGWWNAKPLAKAQAQAEAACIAEFIREQCTHQGRSYRDIGILYSATTHVMELEQALNAREIAYQVTGSKKLIERGEIIALRAVVAALDNPFDEMSVVGVLRSPFFACSDEELLQQRLAGAGFNYVRDEGRVPYLDKCFAILRDLHAAKSHGAPSETIAELFERTKGLQIFALKPQGVSRVANLLKMLDLARALDKDSAVSFHGFARRLAKLEETRVGEEDSITAETGDDVVQLLTFHKAKGLEFPVVVLFRLGQDHERQKDNVIIRRGTHELDFSAHQGFETAGYTAAREDEADRDRCEAMRRLYVAMTRAQDQLVIPAYWSESTKGFYDLLRGRFESDENNRPSLGESRFALHDTSNYSLETQPAEALKIELSLPESSPIVLAAQQRREQWRKHRDHAAESLVREKYFAAPSRASDLHSYTDRVEAFRDKGAFGSYVHRLLEQISLADGSNLDAVSLSAAEEFGIHGASVTAGCELVRRALASELFARVRNADAVYRELPFTDVQDGVLWEGTIDLLLVEQDRLVIVDFKTDRIAESALVRQTASYEPQLRAYRRVMEKITGQTVAESLLYFLHLDRLVRVENGPA